MVTGNEYKFEDIDKALGYVLDTERRALAADPHRQNPPVIIRPHLGMHPVPVDSLDYPLGAWFNDESDDKFVMTRLMSGRYSLKPNLRNRKFLFRGESEYPQMTLAEVDAEIRSLKFDIQDYRPAFTEAEMDY